MPGACSTTRGNPYSRKVRNEPGCDHVGIKVDSDVAVRLRRTHLRNDCCPQRTVGRRPVFIEHGPRRSEFSDRIDTQTRLARFANDPIDHGENGLLVRPQDSEDLASALLRFIDDPSLAGRMGKASRALAESRYDVRSVNAQLLAAMRLSRGDTYAAPAAPIASEFPAAARGV